MRQLYRVLLTLPLVLLFRCSNQSGSPLRLEEMSIELIETFESTVPEFQGYLADPYSCDFDRDGKLYVLDQKEHHIVVFDEDLRVTKLIGREGDGPGEFRFGQMGAWGHRLAISGDYLVVIARQRNIHVFKLDGTYINRFILMDGATDVAVKDDGGLYLMTLDEESPIRSYDIHGNELGQLGHPMFTTGINYLEMREASWIYMANRCELEIMQDGRLATYSPYWSRLRLYSGDQFSEHEVDLVSIAVGEPRSIEKHFIEMMNDFRTHPPERITEIARSRVPTREDVPSGWLLIRFRAVGNEVWGLIGGRFFQMNEQGGVIRVIQTELGIPWEFAIHDNRIACCISSAIAAGIAVGTLPSVTNKQRP